ncbi:MAG: amidinotransferase [Sphingobacteriales bacterium]|nr:amidinotransferase [Sphingobacteriales bacterium]
MSKQCASHLMMVRPASFQFNAETALSNAFQKKLDSLTPAQINRKAIEEFDNYVAKLRANQMDVLVIEDTPEPPKPDAIFPNNWISMHRSGLICLYPMCTPNRRLEMRKDILKILKQNFVVKNIKDMSGYSKDNLFLEGTGSIILDKINKVAYACLSPRTDSDLFNVHCHSLGYEPVSFSSYDSNNTLVYHTNVMLTVGDGFAVICLKSIKSLTERKYVREKLKNTGHELIEISFEQMNAFAGNMLQVENKDGKTFLILSETAFHSLNNRQISKIEKYTTILPVSIPTIETIGGGSARCMIAEIFLSEK